VSFSQVKAILDSVLANWQADNGIPPNLTRHQTPNQPPFAWRTAAELQAAWGKGVPLIQPEMVGNGQGAQTNLVVDLRTGMAGRPRMPMGGPYLSAADLQVIVDWIDAGCHDGPQADNGGGSGGRGGADGGAGSGGGGRAGPQGNGLSTFDLHAYDVADSATLRGLAEERDSTPAFTFAAAPAAQTDPETVARRYLLHALESDRAPAFTAPEAGASARQFKVIGTETLPLTGTRTVKFRQAFHDIPVYGSLVTVELDEANDLVSLSSALGEPAGVSPVAKVSPAEAARAVDAKPPFDKLLKDIAPRLNFFFDRTRGKWRLVYIFEDVPVTKPREKKGRPEPVSPRYFDYVVDAHTGTVAAVLPRTPSMASEMRLGQDARNVTRQIRVETTGGRAILKDVENNIQTYDFGFRDPDIDDSRLPGAEVAEPWSADAVSAHANATSVALFLRRVLLRNNIDNAGGSMNSSVNCVVTSESDDGQQWFNAYWNGRQMVYGQIKNGDRLVSLSASVDIVGHEMLHGVTDSTARLEYAFESGALNESYSDIFGVMIANWPNPDPRGWEWRLGLGFARGGGPFRDMSDPPACGQPGHMDDYRVLPNTRRGDYGGVHTNSGIHNKAAYNVMTAADGQGVILVPREAAAIFYIALTQHLSRTSAFADSRRASLTAARTLFRALPVAELSRKIGAIERGFDEVGIG